MNAEALRDLAVLTLKTPAAAARVLMGMGLPTRFLWLALALMAVLSALEYALALVMQPVRTGQGILFLPSPFVYLLMVGLGLYGLVWTLYLVGRWMGGTGSVQDVLVVITWLQFLRVVVQAVTLVLSVVFPAVSLLLPVVVLIVGLWILLHFINEAHALGSLGKAAGVLIAAGLVTLMLASVVITIVIAPFLGEMGNV